MATYDVIINARTKQVYARSNGSGDGTRIIAIDLPGDIWRDFEHFVAGAREFESAGRLPERNRYVRWATSALFSHLDGVVSHIVKTLVEKDSRFRKDIGGSAKYSLSHKINKLWHYTKNVRRKSLKRLNTDLKFLRDIVNHPSIAESVPDSRTRQTIFLDGTDVYGLAVDDLINAGAEVNSWLDKLCKIYKYERFCDTEKLCTDFAKALAQEDKRIDDLLITVDKF